MKDLLEPSGLKAQLDPERGVDQRAIKPLNVINPKADLPDVQLSFKTRLDPATHQVWRGDQEIEISAKEFAVLEVFMRRPGELLSRFQLLEHAWDYEYENRSNIVDSYVRLLRKKIDRPFGVESIQTVRGAGYRMRENGGAS